jgi:hypothetical protein
VNFPTTPNNQLGNEVGNPTIVSGQVTWASNFSIPAYDLAGTGVLKGPAMGQPLMTLAEAKFLQAESMLNNSVAKPGIAGDFEAMYLEGISASFTYMHKDQNEAVVLPQVDTALTVEVDPEPHDQPTPISIDSLVEEYIANNSAHYYVDITTATNEDQRREAIITQKYIAINMINSDEGYNEYRRTGYPVSSAVNAASNIASNKSTVLTRGDKLPTRVMYPSSEASYNASNYRLVDYGADLIFWDPN